MADLFHGSQQAWHGQLVEEDVSNNSRKYPISCISSNPPQNSLVGLAQ